MSAITRIGGEVFDSRDVLDALDECEGGADESWTQEDEEFYQSLLALHKWGEENVSDWQYGETLIREDHFTEYTEQLAEDCGYMTVQRDPYNYGNRKEARDLTLLSQEWPFRHIDWEAAAEELKQDYTEVEFQGNTYFVRSG